MTETTNSDLPFSFPHLTLSVVPSGTWAIGLVLSSTFIKLVALKLELGICWERHVLGHGLL